jgi:hypothetical protein
MGEKATVFERVAPSLAKAHAAEREVRDAERWRGISKCWQNFGFHVYGAGPCFDTHEQAIAYRDAYDRDPGGTERRWRS